MKGPEAFDRHDRPNRRERRGPGTGHAPWPTSKFGVILRNARGVRGGPAFTTVVIFAPPAPQAEQGTRFLR